VAITLKKATHRPTLATVIQCDASISRDGSVGRDDRGTPTILFKSRQEYQKLQRQTDQSSMKVMGYAFGTGMALALMLIAFGPTALGSSPYLTLIPVVVVSLFIGFKIIAACSENRSRITTVVRKDVDRRRWGSGSAYDRF